MDLGTAPVRAAHPVTLSTMPNDHLDDCPTGDEQSLIDAARLLLATTAGWIAPAVHRLPVHVARGINARSQTTPGSAYLALDAISAEAGDADISPVHLTAAHLLTCLWRVLLGVDYRRTLHGGDDLDQWAWDLAADAICGRTAATTSLHTDAGARYLPRPGKQITPHQLAGAYPIEDPTRISLEDLYSVLRTEDGNSDEDQSPEPFTGTAEQSDIPKGASELDQDAVTHLSDLVSSAVSELAQGVGVEIPQTAVDAAVERGHAELDLMAHFRGVLGAVVSTADAGPLATYQRPSRIEDPDLIFPGRAHSRRSLMFAVDSSPSMSDAQIAAAAAECTSAAEQRGFSVSYVSVAEKVSECRTLRRGEDPVVERGYDTDMTLGFEAFDAAGPDAAVMVTDGETDWPESAPRTRNILIAIVPDLDSGSDAELRAKVAEVSRICPWATVVALPLR